MNNQPVKVTNPQKENLEKDYKEAKRIFEQKLDKFLKSEATNRPITLADMMFALGVIKEMLSCTVTDIAQIAVHLTSKDTDSLNYFQPTQSWDYIEHSFFRDVLYNLYFAHQCGHVQPGSDVFEAENEANEAEIRLNKYKANNKKRELTH
jgi:hypothetical protein